MADWEPVELAPENGEPKRLRGRYPGQSQERKVIGFYKAGGHTEGWVDERYNVFYATHWKPLITQA